MEQAWLDSVDELLKLEVNLKVVSLDNYEKIKFWIYKSRSKIFQII